ncbi:hypothetical protein Plhal304r1_c007g0028131 [Plasmopara halstedii]
MPHREINTTDLSSLADHTGDSTKPQIIGHTGLGFVKNPLPQQAPHLRIQALYMIYRRPTQRTGWTRETRLPATGCSAPGTCSDVCYHPKVQVACCPTRQHPYSVM